jgi:hypothetical protein
LGVEAINEDLFDLNELTEDEDELAIAPSSARASTTYLSTVREVIFVEKNFFFLWLERLDFKWILLPEVFGLVRT